MFPKPSGFCGASCRPICSITSCAYALSPSSSNIPASGMRSLRRTGPKLRKQRQTAQKIFERLRARGDAARPRRGRRSASFPISTQDPRDDKLIEAFDAINDRLGPGSIQFGPAAQAAAWRSSSAFRSPCYTTRWEDIPMVKT